MYYKIHVETIEQTCPQDLSIADVSTVRLEAGWQ